VRGAWLAALLLLLPLALPPAAAQAPGNPFAPSVAVDAPAAVSVPVGTTVLVNVTVSNTQQATTTPLDQPRSISIAVSGAPDGWSALLSSTLEKLPPGRSVTLRLTLTVTASAKEGTATLQVTAHALLLGPTADPDASAVGTIKATRYEEPVRAFVEAVGPAVVVGGLAVLAVFVVVLAIVALRRRGPLRLSVEPDGLALGPGTSGTLALTIRNAGRRAESVLLEGAAGRGWEVEVPLHVLDIEPGGAPTVEVTVACGKRAGPSELVLVAVAQRQGSPATRLVAPLTVTSRADDEDAD
jgi:uncharacterized membrane protein